jgi:hypothetical protein
MYAWRALAARHFVDRYSGAVEIFCAEKDLHMWDELYGIDNELRSSEV